MPRAGPSNYSKIVIAWRRSRRGVKRAFTSDILQFIIGVVAFACWTNTLRAQQNTGVAPGQDKTRPRGTDFGSLHEEVGGSLFDAHWFLLALPDPSSAGTIVGPASCWEVFPDEAWYGASPASAEAAWIGPPASNGQGTKAVPAGTYSFVTHFALPDLDPATRLPSDLKSTTIQAAFALAGTLQEVLVNGVDAGVRGGSSSTLTYFQLNSSNAPLVAGDNTIQFNIKNDTNGTCALFFRDIAHDYQFFLDKNSARLTTFPLNKPFAYAIPTTSPAFDFAATGLPAGLSIDAKTGIISGAATVTGSFPITVTADDRIGGAVFSEAAPLTINVSEWTGSRAAGGAVISFGGGTFVSVDAAGTAFVSRQSGPWSRKVNAFANRIPRSIAFGRGIFVAVAPVGGIYTSVDGLSWTPQLSGASGVIGDVDLNGVAFGDGRFVAVGQGGKIFTSTDGVTWSNNSPSPSNGADLSAVAFGDDRFLAVGDATAATSQNGTDWTSAANPPGSMDTIAFGNGLFVTGGSDENGACLSTSINGESWTLASHLAIDGIKSIAFDGATFVAIGSAGFFSQDALNWEPTTLPAYFIPAQVACGGGSVVAVGSYTNFDDANAGDDIDFVASRKGEFPPTSEPALFSFSEAAYQTGEAAGVARLILTRSGNTEAAAAISCVSGPPRDTLFQEGTIQLEPSGTRVTYSTGGSNFIKSYTAIAGKDYGPINSVVTFGPGELEKVIVVSVFDRHQPSAGRREFSVQLVPLTDLAALGSISVANISILNDHVAVQIETATDVQGAVNVDDGFSRSFSAKLHVLNSSFAAAAAPLQVKLVAHAGYVNQSFDPPPILPPDMDLGVFPIAGSIPPGGVAMVDVDGVVPGSTTPIDASGIENESQAIFWVVCAILEEQSGGTWNDSPSAWNLIDGTVVSKNGIIKNQGGVTQTSAFSTEVPTFTGQQTPTLESVSITGPDLIDEFGTGKFSAVCAFSDGSTQAASNPVWNCSRFTVSSAGVLSTGAVSAPTTVTLTASVLIGGVNKQASKTVQVAPLKPGISLVALTPYARRTGSTLPGAFRLSRTGSQAHPLTVNVNVPLGGAGAAQAGKDYLALPATVTFPEGSATADLAVTPLTASGPTSDESVTLTLSPVSKGAPYRLASENSAVVTIVGTDSLQFAESALTSLPGASSIMLTVQRDPNDGATDPISVHFATADDTAFAGTDYRAISGTLIFGSGIAAQTISVPLSGNAFANGNRSFTVTLSNPQSGACLGTPNVCTATIAQNAIASPASFEGAYFGIGSDATPAFLQVAVGRGGAFSAAIRSPGLRFALAGAFDSYGYFSRSFPGSGKTTLRVELQESASQLGAITGRVLQVAEGNVTTTIAQLQATANGYSAKSNPFVQAGSYTMLLPRDLTRSSEAGYPQGDGFAVLRVSSAGSVQAAGVLGDGEPFSLGSGVSSANQFPFYLNPYRIPGLVAGSISFGNIPSVSDLAGALVWNKPPQSGMYASGFAGNISAIGSFYQSPPKGQLLLPINPNTAGDAQATVLLADALGTDLTESIAITPADKVALASPDPSFALKLSRWSGYFTGHFVNAGDTAKANFKGIIYGKQNIAQGLFIRHAVTGHVEIGR